jgi:hypothetical protein
VCALSHHAGADRAKLGWVADDAVIGACTLDSLWPIAVGYPNLDAL